MHGAHFRVESQSILNNHHEMRIAYRIRIDGEGVVFAPEDRAVLVNRIREVISSGISLSEFAKQFPADIVEEVKDYVLDEDDPDDNPIIDANSAWEPPWLQQEMLSWFPKDLAKKYGSGEETMHDGDYLHIRPECMNEVVAELEKRGHELVHRPDLDDFM